jgi:hypothetical protein
MDAEKDERGTEKLGEGWKWGEKKRGGCGVKESHR